MSASFIDGFLIGTQLSVVIQRDDTGAQVALDGRRTTFSVEERGKLETSEPIDNGGLVEDLWVPGGWQGTINVDRKSDSFSALRSQLDAAFYAGLARVTFTIFTVEPAADLSYVAQYRHTKCVFHGYKPGEWTRERVKPSVQFVCQQRIKVA
jgi:hypothetical protein